MSPVPSDMEALFHSLVASLGIGYDGFSITNNAINLMSLQVCWRMSGPGF